MRAVKKPKQKVRRRVRTPLHLDSNSPEYRREAEAINAEAERYLKACTELAAAGEE